MKRSRYLLRNPKGVVVTGRDEVILAGIGTPIILSTEHPEAWSALSRELSGPQPVDAVLRHGAITNLPGSGDNRAEIMECLI